MDHPVNLMGVSCEFFVSGPRTRTYGNATKKKVNYGSLSLSCLIFFFRSSPDGGRDIPFSFMLTVSSFLEIQPPIL